MEQSVFTNSKVSKIYLNMSLPLVFSLVVSLVYNLADTYFVAQTNNTNLVAGVSLGMPVFTVLMALGNIFGQGGSSLISRLLGQKEYKSVQHISAFCFYGAILFGMIMLVLMVVFRTPMLYLIGASTETFSYASDYYIYLAIGAPFILLSFIPSNLLRAEGLSKESMVGSILGAVVNIVLDPIFIFGLGMEAAGAAIATVIGYICQDLFFIYIIIRKSKNLSLHPGKMKISGKYLRQIFGIGIPAALANIMQSVSTVLVNQFLLSYGDDKIAAMGIVLKVNMIATLFLTGFTFGGQPVFGYYYGAGDKKRLNEALRFSFRFISGLAVALTVIIFTAAPALMKCFMNNAGIVQTGTVMLRWQVITTFCVGIILLLTIIFQSLGNVKGSFVLSICRQGVVFLVVLAVAYPLAGYMGIVAAQAIADVITLGIAVVLFYKQISYQLR